MKKLVWISLALCVLLCACDRKDPPVTTDRVVTTDPVVTTTAVQTTEPPATEPIELSFAVKTVSPALGKGMAVKYEVLTTGDADLDALFEKAAQAEFANHIPNASSVSSNGGSADYEVTMESFYADETIISAAFVGQYSLFYEDSSGMEEGGEVLYTVLVDPVAKKLLTSADIVSDFGKLKDAFTSGKFASYGVPPFADDLSQYRIEYGIYPYVSMDADNFYLYIAESGMGEYTTMYSIPRADAADFLKY
ncbi:MAG: hypothetical protein IIU58_03815 [Clostridia bacterium]|nr:hypothetical protein [Clostridia bacterium]